MFLKKSPITTHVLDTSRGKPAARIAVALEFLADGWQIVGGGLTDADVRNSSLVDGNIEKGIYRLTFLTGKYFEALGIESFFPEVSIVFRVDDPKSHYHVPLLLSPFGYSTYRGS